MPSEYFAVYDADGSLAGEISYALGKLAGGQQCALCDISHGWNPLGKSQWRSAKAASCGLQWLHRDEQPEDLASFTAGQLPVVVAKTGEAFRVILSADQLVQCQGDYARFQEQFETAVVAALDTAAFDPDAAPHLA